MNLSKQSLENICSEFSDKYTITKDELGYLLGVEIDIQYLGDLTGVFDRYDIELIELRSVSGDTEMCMAIFSRLEIPFSEDF